MKDLIETLIKIKSDIQQLSGDGAEDAANIVDKYIDIAETELADRDIFYNSITIRKKDIQNIADNTDGFYAIDFLPVIAMYNSAIYGHTYNADNRRSIEKYLKNINIHNTDMDIIDLDTVGDDDMVNFHFETFNEAPILLIYYMYIADIPFDYECSMEGESSKIGFSYDNSKFIFTF